MKIKQLLKDDLIMAQNILLSNVARFRLYLLKNPTAKKEGDTMTKAEQIIAEEFTGEDTPEDYGLSSYLGVGGLIFTDGSVIDVGEGADHRSILPEPQWNERMVITYRVFSHELTIRIHRQITWLQFERIKELIELFNVETVYYGYYDNNDQLKAGGAEDIYSFYNVVEEYIR